jgi:two-component system, cell cycle sensor histidine kinase and response regulator CckA
VPASRLPFDDDPVLQHMDTLGTGLPRTFMQWRVAIDGSLFIEHLSDPVWTTLLGRPAPPPAASDGTGFWAYVDPRDSDALRQSLLRGGPPDADWQAPWRMAGANGQPCWLQGVGRPWSLPQGGWRCRAFITALSDGRAAQAARDASEQRFRDLIDAIPNIAVQGYDHRLVCRFWNAASEQLYGYTEQEAIGTSLLDLIIPPSMSELVVQATADMLDTGRAIPSAELVLQDKAGRPVHVHSGHVLLQRAGQAPEFFCIDFDLSERRQAEEARRLLESQMRDMQKMEALGTLAGGIAHDFNNIVAAILGNVNLAIEDTAPDSPALTSLSEIQKAGRRARGLTQQILTFARRQAEKREPTAIGPLVDELPGIFKTSLPPDTRLTVAIDDPLPPVMANATQMEQVLLNLVTNALQAASGRADGLVSVHVRACEGPPDAAPGQLEVLRSDQDSGPAGLMLDIGDNGTGMPADIVHRIFEPFFTTKSAQKGTGLGLAVVHGILRDHDATLHLRTAPGQGTTFSIWLAAAP